VEVFDISENSILHLNNNTFDTTMKNINVKHSKTDVLIDLGELTKIKKIKFFPIKKTNVDISNVDISNVDISNVDISNNFSIEISNVHPDNISDTKINDKLIRYGFGDTYKLKANNNLEPIFLTYVIPTVSYLRNSLKNSRDNLIYYNFKYYKSKNNSIKYLDNSIIDLNKSINSLDYIIKELKREFVPVEVELANNIQIIEFLIFKLDASNNDNEILVKIAQIAQKVYNSINIV
jgi:hypothetical protein